MKSLTLFLPFVFCLITATSEAQVNNPSVGLGQWRIHLPYFDGTVEAIGNGRVFCATHYALFSYKLDDGSIQRYSRVNALSDFEISTCNAFSKFCFNEMPGTFDLEILIKSITSLSWL